MKIKNSSRVCGIIQPKRLKGGRNETRFSFLCLLLIAVGLGVLAVRPSQHVTYEQEDLWRMFQSQKLTPGALSVGTLHSWQQNTKSGTSLVWKIQTNPPTPCIPVRVGSAQTVTFAICLSPDGVNSNFDLVLRSQGESLNVVNDAVGNLKIKGEKNV